MLRIVCAQTRQDTMHRHHSYFLQALKENRKVRLIYHRGGDKRNFEAKACIPLAYVPGLRSEGEEDNYHFLDVEQVPEGRPLDLKSDEIIQMTPDREGFDPAELAIPDVHKDLDP